MTEDSFVNPMGEIIASLEPLKVQLRESVKYTKITGRFLTFSTLSSVSLLAISKPSISNYSHIFIISISIFFVLTIISFIENQKYLKYYTNLSANIHEIESISRDLNSLAESMSEFLEELKFVEDLLTEENKNTPNQKSKELEKKFEFLKKKWEIFKERFYFNKKTINGLIERSKIMTANLNSKKII